MKHQNSFQVKPVKMFQRLLTVFGFMLFAGFATAQVAGTVLDQGTGEPLVGATVAIKGTTSGAITDVNGRFNLPTAKAGDVLTVTYTGFTAQTITVGSERDITVNLDEGSSISEVVVTGYTVDTRRQTTSAVSTVKTKDLTAVPTGNVEQQLQGRVAGVTVITNGQPGTSSLVRVRGFGSFSNNQPLFVVDGVPTQNIDFLTPEDIENTTVMKDASSASIYGARAAGGVIVVTTKHGSKTPQKLQVSYDALFGSTDPGTGPGILNPQEQADYTWLAQKNAGLAPSHPQYGSGATPVLPEYINVGGQAGITGGIDLNAERAKYNVNPDNGAVYQVVKANKAGTDWYGAITRNAPLTRHNLGFSGSTENARYYVGLSLQDQAGILTYNEFKRHTARINTEFNLGKRVRIGQNMQITYRQRLGDLGGGGGSNVAQDENSILGAFRMPTIIPIYDEFGGYAGTAAKGFNNPRNPVAERDAVKDNHAYNGAAFGNVYAEVDILDGLTLRTSVGGNYTHFYGYGFNRRSYENSENNSSFSYNEFAGKFFSWVFSNTIRYKKVFGEHSLDLLAGQEAIKDGLFRSINGSGLNPFSQDPNYINLSTVSNLNVTSFSGTPYTYSSYFGRVQYGFRDKYYATAVLRRDGSSRFGTNSRFGVFPGFSAAWRVTGEDFMKGVSWLDDLKIRGGWGQMGNDQVNPANQFSLFAASLGNSAYDISGSNTAVAEGYYQSRVGNPNAKWETNITSNVGFEALLLKGKFDIIVDFWRRQTNDLLFQVPQAQVLGPFAAAPAQNIASMVNEGIDIQVVNKGRLGGSSRYELTLTGSFLRNEITELTDKLDYFDVNPASNRLAGTMVRNQVGQSISSFFGYEVLGYFKDAADVAASPTQDGAGPGRFKYADVDGLDDKGQLTGKPDGKIDAADRTFIGSPVPKFTGGANLKVTFGSFDVETYLYTSLGNKIFHLGKWFTDFYPSFTGAAIGERAKNSWTPNNLDAETPIYEVASNFSTNTQANSWYVEDGSFLRMQNLSIGYNLPKTLLNKWGMKRARVYAATNNVFTLTKYKGLDPAVGGAADTNFGIDVGNYPVTRSVMVGLGLTF